MVGFSKKKVLTETIGERLSRCRNERGISLEEVAGQINVKREYLEKIEKNDLTNLPPDVYVRGYLRKYADFLKLDVRAILSQYEKERGIQRNISAFKNPVISSEPSLLSGFSITITPKLLAFFSFLLLFIFGTTYFYQEIKKFSSDPLLSLSTSQSRISVDKDWFEIEGSAERDSRVFINNQPVNVDGEGKFKEKIFLRKGSNQIVVKAVNKIKKETIKELEIYAWYESAFSEEKEDVNF